MSEVISFRLNKDNLREGQALDILETWCNEGYSIRHVITEALLKLNGDGYEEAATTLDELQTTLNQVVHLLEQLGNDESTKVKEQESRSGKTGLTYDFIASIKKYANTGVKL